MANQRKQKDSGLKNSRQTAAKQAAKRRSKGLNRISKDQVADVTAKINTQFAQVQTLYATQTKQTRCPAADPAPLEPSVQDLVDVMTGL